MAGRKEKYTVDYFPHSCKHGKTLFIMESKYGNDGYAVWFKTLEILGDSENHFIDCRDTATWEYMQAKMHVNGDLLLQMYNTLAHLGKIDADLWSNRVIWCAKFVQNVMDAYARRLTSPMSKTDLCAHLSILCEHKCSSGDISDDINTQSKVKESKVDNNNMRTELCATQTPKESDTSIHPEDTPLLPEDYKPKDDKGSVAEEYPFSEFWEFYDKKRDKGRAERLYKKISLRDRKCIFATLQAYKDSTPDKQYRKNPDTYLRNRTWEDEIIVNNRSKQNPTNEEKRIEIGRALAETAIKLQYRKLSRGEITAEQFKINTGFEPESIPRSESFYGSCSGGH